VAALSFDGTNDRVRWNSVKEAIAKLPAGAHTALYLLNRNAANLSDNYDAIGYLLSGSSAGNGTAQSGISFKGAVTEAERDRILWDVGTQSLGATRFTNITDPLLIIVSKATGSAKPRIGWKFGAGGGWTHLDLAANIGNAAEATMLEVGAWQNGDFLNAHVGAVALWSGAMSDAHKEALGANWRTSDIWNSAHGNPVFLCELNVAVASLVDLAGNASSIQAQASSNYPTLDAGESLGGWSFNGKGATTKTLGQATEADAAQPRSFTKTIRKTLTPAAEAGSAQAVVRSKRVAVNSAGETSGAAARSVVKLAASAPAAETDAAQTPSRRKTVALPQAVESDSPQPLTASRLYTLTRADETDAAQGAGRLKRFALVPGEETGAAVAVVPLKTIRKLLSAAVEADAALSVAAGHRVALDAAAESGSVVPISLLRVAPLATAEEHGEAQELAYRNISGPIPLIPAHETNQANGLSFVKPIHVGLITGPEASQAVALDYRKPVLLSLTPAQEGNGATSLVLLRRVGLTPSTESNGAIALRLAAGRLLVPVVETSSAVPVSLRQLFGLTPAEEVDLALALLTEGFISPNEVAIALSVHAATNVELSVSAATTRLTLSTYPATTLDLEVGSE